jgi:precorrin-6B methylase 2
MSKAVLRRIEPADDRPRQSLSDIGDRSGHLGVEIADMAGLVGDLTALGQQLYRRARRSRQRAR